MESETTRFFFSMFATGLTVGLLIFRRLSPLLVAGIPPLIGVLWTLGLLGWLGIEWTMMSLAMPILIFVVGFTDGIHLVLHMLRHPENDRRGAREAGLQAVRVVGRACLLTSLTTAVGFGSLMLADSGIVRLLGISCALGTMTTFVTVIFMVPLLTGTWLGRYLLKRKRQSFADRKHTLMRPLVRRILARPRAISVAGVGLTLALASSALHIRVDTFDNQDWIPTHCESIQAYYTYIEAFKTGMPLQVLVDWSDAPEPVPASLLNVLQDIHTVIEEDPHVSYPMSILNLLKSTPYRRPSYGSVAQRLARLPEESVNQMINLDKRCAVVNVHFSREGVAENIVIFDRLDQALKRIQDRYRDIHMTLTGFPVVASRMAYSIIRDLARSLCTALVIITIMMACAFRSLRLGLICLIPNMLPLAALTAMLVLIHRSLNAPNAILFTVCLGIAVDDTIHFVTRYQRERRSGYTSSEAIQRSFNAVGKALVVTTLILVFGSCGMLVSHLAGYRFFTLLACTSFAAALLGDLLILPALIQWRDRRSTAAHE